MKKYSTRILAMLMCVLMCVSLLPLTALAAAAPEVVRENSGEKVSVVSNGKPKITSQPKSKSVMQGKTVTFKVSATGGSLKYQWYYRKSASGSWTKMSGKTSASLKITAKRYDGYQYRCKVSNKSGSVTSKAATLTVNYVQYRALLIGQSYSSTSLQELYGSQDLSYMRDLLNKVSGPKGGKYDYWYGEDVSYSGIKYGIDEFLCQADSNDVSLFYFSGHGDSSSYDSYAGALCTVEDSSYSLLQLNTLASWLKTVPGKVIVLIDSCGSGAAVAANGRLVSGAAAADRFNQAVINAFAAVDETINEPGAVSNTGELRTSKFVVLTSSAYHENSGYTSDYNGDPVSHFTYWLWYGAVPYGNRKMDADANGNHIVTITELYKFIKKYDSYDANTQHVKMYASSASYPMFKS